MSGATARRARAVRRPVPRAARRLVPLAAVAVLAMLAVSARAADVALENGRFTAGAGDAPTGWSAVAWARDTAQLSWAPPGDGGSGSAVIRNLAPNDARWCQTITVQPGATYRVTARARTEDVGTQTAGAHIGIERIADSGDVRGTHDWQPLEVSARAGEETQWDVCVRLGSYSNLNTGTAWFTDVAITETVPPPPKPSVVATALRSAWEAARASGISVTLPLVGGLLLAFGFGILLRPRPR